MRVLSTAVESHAAKQLQGDSWPSAEPPPVGSFRQRCGVGLLRRRRRGRFLGASRIPFDSVTPMPVLRVLETRQHVVVSSNGGTVTLPAQHARARIPPVGDRSIPTGAVFGDSSVDHVIQPHGMGVPNANSWRPVFSGTAQQRTSEANLGSGCCGDPRDGDSARGDP